MFQRGRCGLAQRKTWGLELEFTFQIVLFKFNLCNLERCLPDTRPRLNESNSLIYRGGTGATVKKLQNRQLPTCMCQNKTPERCQQMFIHHSLAEKQNKNWPVVRRRIQSNARAALNVEKVSPPEVKRKVVPSRRQQPTRQKSREANGR